ncbi:MAG TPA: LptF/LptG family permease [Candidatus Baltobacteraceae bacterium]|nr:LptF/LptG family permease [Candidatus Baltobacteraceae bacterium]
MKSLRLSILDRYMLSELAGPFLFGLSAFTLIFAATQIIAIGRIVSETHAPLWAAIEVFLWQLPGIFVLAIPMALLLGTLLAIQRLSGESEITAMKAGGVTFLRIVAPMLIAGFVMSFVTLFLQERVVPFAREEANVVQNTIINRASAFASSLNVSAPLPGGGSQMTFARACAQNCEALLGVTLVQYDRAGNPTRIVFADRAVFQAQKWTLDNARIYQFAGNGDGVATTSSTPTMQVELGENPTEMVKRAVNNNPDDMNRAQIAQIIRTGQLSASELKKYTMVFQQKLAMPFACFVFTLLAVPYGIRSIRGGGSTSLGFGLAVLIVFVYYIVQTFFSYVGEAYLQLAFLAAWMPNIIFTIFGARRLYRAAMV